MEAVVHADPHDDVVRALLGVLDRDIEITVVLEHAGVEDLVFGITEAAAGVFRHQVVVGEGGLRVLVEHAHVRMAGNAIEVEVQLLDVLAGQAEQPLLENGVVFVPQGQAQAPVLGLVGESGQAILAPAVGPAAGMVVGKVGPGVAVGTVVLAHRAPLPLAEVGAPFAPFAGVFALETLAFNGIGSACRRFFRHR